MLSKTHRLVETITSALSPIFHANPEFPTIVDAMCLVMARVIQSSPDKGREFQLLDHVHLQTAHCLEEFLKLEAQLDAQKEARQGILDKGIDGFLELGRINGNHHASEAACEVVEPPALRLVEEPEIIEPIEPGGFADHPENSGAPVAKTVKPYPQSQAEVERLLKDAAERDRAAFEEDQAFQKFTQLPEGIVIPAGVSGNQTSFTDPDGVFVEPLPPKDGPQDESGDQAPQGT